MRKKLDEYFEATKNVEYEDEKVQSNLLNVSLVKSCREMDGLKGTEDYLKYEEKNKWLYELCNRIQDIPIICFDSLKMQVNADYKSCDGFFYNADKKDNKYSLLFEFKNVNRKKILEFIENEDNESIYCKVRDSVTMIKNDIEFEEGYSGEELIRRTHFIIVYGDKADTVSAANLGFVQKKKPIKDKNGRQSKAVNWERNREKVYSNKKEEEILINFGEKLQRMNLKACEKGYLGIPIHDPKAVKIKGCGTLFHFTMFSKHDFVKMINEIDYFVDWNWGKYTGYLNVVNT